MTSPTNPPQSPTVRPRRKPPLIFKLIVLGFVVIVGLVFAEIAVRITYPTMSAGPMQTRPDAYYGYWLRPNLDCVVTNSKGIRYHEKTNSLGHRAPEYTDAPRGHIICFGDSYTMGETVDAGDEYPAVLRDALRPRGYEVVNFGRAGNGQGRWLKFLLRDLEDYTPKVVVMQLCYNDFGDNEVEKLFSLNDAGELEALAVPGPGAADRIRDVIESIPGLAYMRTYQLVKQMARGSRAAQSFHPDQIELSPEERAAQDALTFALIRRCMELSRDAGAAIIWTSVNLPEDRAQRMRTLGEEFCAIEVPIEFNDVRPELYNAEDPHWNKAGQHHVGESILRAIDDNGLLTPAS